MNNVIIKLGNAAADSKLLLLLPCNHSTNFQGYKFVAPISWKTLAIGRRWKLNTAARASNNGGGGSEEVGGKRSFLSIEEAGMVEMSGLVSHEKFLCRLTISSLNLLRVIAEQEECSIEELNAGRVCDWFLKDKLKREQNLDSAVLQWDESNFQL